MSDSLPPSAPDNTPQPADVPAGNVPNSSEEKDEREEIEFLEDPEALAADRAGFKFLAIGFAIFFAIIAICAGVVALAMKNMGI